MLHLVMHLSGKVWIRIVTLLALRPRRADHVVRSIETSGSQKIVSVDDSMADAWIRQQDRIRKAIAQATPKHVPMDNRLLDDEWVGPWIRQQQRVREAIAQAKLQAP